LSLDGIGVSPDWQAALVRKKSGETRRQTARAAPPGKQPEVIRSVP
jgi:hypothetical protein